MEDDRINWDSRAPHGETEETREVIRRYLPMREYDDIEANDSAFECVAEVEMLDDDKGSKVSLLPVCLYCVDDDKYQIFSRFIDSYISPTGPTWRELIEREICRQAVELPGWKNEYKEAPDGR